MNFTCELIDAANDSIFAKLNTSVGNSKNTPSMLQPGLPSILSY